MLKLNGLGNRPVHVKMDTFVKQIFSELPFLGFFDCRVFCGDE